MVTVMRGFKLAFAGRAIRHIMGLRIESDLAFLKVAQPSAHRYEQECENRVPGRSLGRRSVAKTIRFGHSFLIAYNPILINT